MASIQQSVKAAGRWRIAGWPRRAVGGGGGLGVGRATDKKYQPVSPGLLLIELQPLAVRPPEKRTKEMLPRPRCMRMMQTGGSAQGTPGTVRSNCWTLRAAASPPPALWWCWLSAGQKSRSSQQNYRPWCQLYTNILYSCYNCIMLYVVMLLSNNRAKVDCITSMVLQPGGNDAVKRVPLS